MTAVYPGSFDPVTLGHVDLAKRASALFDKLIIAVYATPTKDLLFDVEERISLFSKTVEDLTNVEVVRFEGLVVRFVKMSAPTLSSEASAPAPILSTNSTWRS